MRTYTLSLLILLGTTTLAQAQTAAPARNENQRLALAQPAAEAAPTSFVLEGQVVSEDGNPLPGATVQVPGTRQVYSTNSEGYFSFTAPRPEQAVQVSLAGYSETQVQLRRGVATPVVLQLLPGTRFKADGRIKKTSSSGKVR